MPKTATSNRHQADAWQILFIQGGGEGTYAEWDTKLVASLERNLGSCYIVHYPRMTNEGAPEFSVWREDIARAVAPLPEGAVLVGHSIGGTVLVHTVAQRPRLLRGIAAICLIAAPFVGEGGWQSDDLVVGRDWAAPLSGVAVRLYQGDADEITPMAHVSLYAKAIPHAKTRILGGRDHQLCNDLSEVARDIRLASGLSR